MLQALHISWHPLAVFCRALEDALGHGVQANSYYTPRGSQGFAVHHDTHDVLILQVAGEKRWLIYEPLLELPLKHQRYTKALGDARRADRRPRAQGRRLALPAARMAPPGRDLVTDSLHLTVGIAAHTWLDAAKGALDACEDELVFRRGVENRDGSGDGLTDLIADQLDPELIERRRRRKFVESRRPIREDGLSQLRALGRLDADDAAGAARDGDRRPRRIVPTGSRSSSRASRSVSRHASSELRASSRATSRSGSPTSPASSTPRAGSCSSAGSSARASSGLRADDAVR